MTPWTVAHQAPLSMGYTRLEYWNGLPFPSPGCLPNPEIKTGSPALQANSIPTEPVIQYIYMVAQMVKCLSTMRGTQVQSLGGEDLKKEMATHSSILAWKIPWMEEPGRLQSMGSQRIRHD